MRYVVEITFNSLTQRFPAGAPVNSGDDLSPHSFSDLVERGFIAAANEDPAPAAAAEPPMPQIADITHEGEDAA
ncbi:MAG: hypothetical protein WDM91_10905 [Rhizomicrobium sp.]